MPALTYGFESARDMLEKLRREHRRLESEVTSDNLFNFVATGYHLLEWVEKDPQVPASAKTNLLAVRHASSIATCRDLTNASKHFSLKLNYQNQVTTSAKSVRGFGVGRCGMCGYGVGEESISIILKDGTTLNALKLARDTVNEWESFFSHHRL